MGKQVIEGIRVADFSWIVAGPLISKCLADYGATVVRMESKRRPDSLRMSAPFKDRIRGVNRTASFTRINGNKYSMALNLTHEKGRDVARRLVAWADVVIENYAPGLMERWGLSYDDLREVKPDIIMVRSSNQGQTGPFAPQPGLGGDLIALTGFIHFTGWPDRAPVLIPVAYTDYVSPPLVVAALIGALNYRRRTGKGQLLDVSQMESSLHFLAPAVLDYMANGETGSRMGNACPHAAPHGAYRCKGNDRWCTIAIFTDEEWDAFCRVVGNPEWTRDARFATLLGRKSNEEELDRLIEGWTIGLTAEEVMNSMQAVGVGAGVVEDAADIFHDPQLKARQSFWTLSHKEIGPFPHLAQPSKLSKTSAEPRMPAPCLGEHTDFVCKELLAMSDEEFDELRVAGIFE